MPCALSRPSIAAWLETTPWAIFNQDNGAQILYFPGCEKAEPLIFGVSNQPGTLDGLLIKISSKDATVPVHLQEGDTVHICSAIRDMARRLAPNLFATKLLPNFSLFFWYRADGPVRR